MEKGHNFMLVLNQEANIEFQKKLYSLRGFLRTKKIKYIPNQSAGQGSIVLMEQRSNTITWRLKSKLDQKNIEYEELFPVENSMFSFFDEKRKKTSHRTRNKGGNNNDPDNQSAENCFEILFSPSPAI